MSSRGLLLNQKAETISPMNLESPHWNLLTPREREIMQWVSAGKTNWEIARILGCVEQTVKKHLQNIYRKLGVENRMAAVNSLRS
jgi:DNA-binding CsgD family transcriptional regulator